MITAADRHPQKALSIRQPWAWLIVHGPKRVENRTWRTSFRGRFFIHASKGMTRDEYEMAKDIADAIDPEIVLPPYDYLWRGGIIGEARIIACLDSANLDDDRRGGSWFTGDYGFLLDDVKPLAFRQCKGALGFFTPDV